MSSYNSELEKLKYEITLEVYKQVKVWFNKLIDDKISQIEKAKRKIDTKIVELSFNPPINIEDAKIKWLQNKILEPHRKYGFKWKYRFIPGSSNVEKLILWIPRNFETRHLDEIKRCVDWINKKSKGG